MTARPVSTMYHFEPLSCLIFDDDVNDIDPSWRPYLLSDPSKTAREMRRMTSALQSSYDAVDSWHEMRFDVLQGVRCEIVNWHRRIVEQGESGLDVNVADWKVFHESGLPELLIKMASNEEFWILDGERHEVCFSSIQVYDNLSLLY